MLIIVICLLKWQIAIVICAVIQKVGHQYTVLTVQGWRTVLECPARQGCRIGVNNLIFVLDDRSGLQCRKCKRGSFPIVAVFSKNVILLNLNFYSFTIYTPVYGLSRYVPQLLN